MSKISVHLIKDAWLREAEEASQWLEDLETRNLSLLNLSQTSTSTSTSHLGVSSVVDSARSKLLELGVKLDRLESLLRNPPTKPILTHEDLDFRWKMLSDIQLRTRTLARSLCALPCPHRPRNAPAIGSNEYNGNTDCCDQDLMKTSYSHDQSELLKPLMSEDDAIRSRVQNEPSSFMSMISLQKACSTFFLLLGLAAFLFLVVLIYTAI